MSFLDALTGYSGKLQIGDVQCDASVSETHALEADITDHPVEKGSVISDNYRQRPKSVQIEGVITDTPIEASFPGATAVSSVTSIITGSDPVKSSWETFKGYFADATLISIYASLESYDDIALSNLSVTRTNKTGQVLRFTCTARQMRIVETLEVDAIIIPKTSQAAKKKSRGNKPKKTASEGKKTSVAARGVDKIGDALTSFFK